MRLVRKILLDELLLELGQVPAASRASTRIEYYIHTGRAQRSAIGTPTVVPGIARPPRARVIGVVSWIIGIERRIVTRIRRIGPRISGADARVYGDGPLLLDLRRHNQPLQARLGHCFRWYHGD